MNTILKALLEVTVYSSVIAGVLLLLRALFKKKISAKLQYMAWLLLIVRLMVPVTLESGVHFFTIKEKPAIVGTATQEAPAESRPAVETPAQAAPQTAPMVSQNTAPQAKPQMNAAPAETAKKLAIHVTWQQVVIGLWIMGMVALGAFFIRTRVRFMRRMKETMQMPSAEMLREYDRICEEMMLASAPELWVCGIESPALMGRRILLPEGLSGQTLRYALYHELTHYRRRDHIMVVLMSALRCVYWFNPLVWVSFSAMQTDMEVACDAGVMERIGADEKRGYLMTLLKMFSSHSVPAIGMAQAESKRAAKARIEGAFRKHRTGRMMRMVSAIAACVILICCFTTACQPTPEKPIVVNKNDGKLEETIEQAASAEKDKAENIVNNIPERWTGEYTENDGKVKFIADVSIEGADLEKYPVVEVRAADFNQQQIDAFLNYFVGDKKIFARGETKKDVERQLINAKQGTEIDGEIVPPEPDDPYIKALEEKLAQMPDDGRYYYEEPKLELTQYGIMQLSAGIELGNGEDATLLIEASGNGKVASSFVYSRGNVFGELVAEMSEITLKEPSISKEAAIKTAEEVIAELGFSDMKLATVYKAELDAVGEGGYFAGCYSTYESAGYQMLFTRELYGMQMTDYSEEGSYSYSSGSESADYQPAYRAPWDPEMISVYVDENGIQQFSYHDYMEETELLAENVQLMDFEEASERAIKQLYYQNALSYNGHEQMKVSIERVVLGGTLINKKNELDKAMIVPAYHIFYQEEFTLQGRTELFVGNNGVIVINAIDGSVIETRI